MAEKQFDNARGQRRYQCFVCGMVLATFEAYKEHIVDKHEEGREYVLCPVQFCKAPVRDLRTHFKVKHAGIPMPEVNGMTRALIWKDMPAKGVTKKGELKTKRPKFKEGWHDSSKCQKRFHYRSGYEATIYECLDADSDVIAYDVEPFELPYIYKGTEHKYTPDIIVHFTTGRTEVWEVKPSCQTMMEKNKCKWYAATNMCKTRGWEFAVITETGIDKLKLKVRKQFEGIRNAMSNPVSDPPEELAPDEFVCDFLETDPVVDESE